MYILHFFPKSLKWSIFCKYLYFSAESQDVERQSEGFQNPGTLTNTLSIIIEALKILYLVSMSPWDYQHFAAESHCISIVS